MNHELKILERYHTALIEKRKTCELRYNDRDYQTGDTIQFIFTEAWINWEKYHHPEKWKITHVLHYPDWLKEWWVVLSLKKV